MPDAWERMRGLNPNDASDAGGDVDRDGTTNIEAYLNVTNLMAIGEMQRATCEKIGRNPP